MKTITKKSLLTLGVLTSTLTILNLTKQNHQINQPKIQTFYSVENLDQINNEDENLNNIAVLEVNSPTIVTKDGKIIILRDKEIEIKNQKQETILKITGEEIGKIVGLNLNLSMFKIFEKNNKLFIISGGHDLYRKQTSNVLTVFDLETKKFDLVYKMWSASETINNISAFDNDKILLWGDSTTLQDLKEGKNSFIYSIDTKHINKKVFEDIDLGLSEEEMKNSYLLNIITNENNDKKYLRLLHSNNKQSFKNKIIEIKSLELIKNDNSILQNIYDENKENSMDYSMEQNFQDGEKIISLDKIEKEYTFLNDDIIMFWNSNTKNSTNLISLFNIKTGLKVNDFKIDYEFLKQVKAEGTTDNNQKKNLFPQDNVDFNNFLNWVFSNARFRFLSIIPENEKSFLATMIIEKTENENASSIYTKGRILRFSFDELYQNLTISVLENDNGELNTWIPENLTTTEDNRKIEIPNYFYGFLNKLKDNQYFISNGLSNLTFLANVENKKVIFTKNNVVNFTPLLNEENINKKQFASRFVKSNPELQFSKEVKNQKLSYNDDLGYVYVSYQLEENGILIDYVEIIKGFRLQPKLIFKDNDDESLSELKSKRVIELEKSDILKANLISFDNPNIPVKPQYVKFERLNSNEIKVSYTDPKLFNFEPSMTTTDFYGRTNIPSEDSFSKIYSNFNEKGLKPHSSNEGVEYLNYAWEFENPELLEAKKYHVSYFDKKISEKIFKITNLSSSELNHRIMELKEFTSENYPLWKRIDTTINEQENSITIKATLSIAKHTFNVIETTIDGFGEKPKPNTEKNIEEEPQIEDFEYDSIPGKDEIIETPPIIINPDPTPLPEPSENENPNNKEKEKENYEKISKLTNIWKKVWIGLGISAGIGILTTFFLFVIGKKRRKDKNKLK